MHVYTAAIENNVKPNMKRVEDERTANEKVQNIFYNMSSAPKLMIGVGRIIQSTDKGM